MAMLTIRNLEPALKERLRVRAAQHARSMEAEARDILSQTLKPSASPPERNLYDRIRARFARSVASTSNSRRAKPSAPRPASTDVAARHQHPLGDDAPATLPRAGHLDRRPTD